MVLMGRLIRSKAFGRRRRNGEGILGETLEGVSGNDLKAAAMLIAFSQLRDSLNREDNFEDDLVLS